jgi:hypothetical protein
MIMRGIMPQSTKLVNKVISWAHIIAGFVNLIASGWLMTWLSKNEG